MRHFALYYALRAGGECTVVMRHPATFQQRAFVSGTSQPDQQQDERWPQSASTADVNLPGCENAIFD